VLLKRNRVLLRGMLAMIVVVGLIVHVQVAVTIILLAYGQDKLGTRVYKVVKYLDL
jgi:hypothetical protein